MTVQQGVRNIRIGKARLVVAMKNG